MPTKITINILKDHDRHIHRSRSTHPTTILILLVIITNT
jgi:hypothetical protein